MRNTTDELLEEARAALATLPIPTCWTVYYGLTASKPHRPCVRLIRAHDGREYEVSFCLPMPELRARVQRFIDDHGDDALRLRAERGS